MAIPNVKRYQITGPDGDVASVMAVLPKDADIDAYLADAASSLRLERPQRSEGERLQGPCRSAEAEEGEVVRAFVSIRYLARSVLKLPGPFLSSSSIDLLQNPLDFRSRIGRACHLSPNNQVVGSIS